MSDKDPMQITSRGAQVVACSVITVFLAAFVVALRFVTRSKILKFVGREDWCIGLALLFSIVNSAGMIIQTEFALGQHISDLSPEQISSFLKACFATEIAYNTSLTIAKISILVLYLQIFHTKGMRIACYTQMGFVVVYGGGLLFSMIFNCTPIALFWDKSLEGYCIPALPTWMASSSINIFTDICIFALPLPVIRTLVLPRKQKIGLYFVFVLGFFVCIVSILRLPVLLLAAKSTDPTWDNVSIANWSCVELNMAIICPSLTTLKPLLARFFPNLLLHSTQQSDQGTADVLKNSNLTGKRYEVLDESRSNAGTLTAGEHSDAETLNTSETFDLVQLESGLVRLAPKASNIRESSSQSTQVT